MLSLLLLGLLFLHEENRDDHGHLRDDFGGHWAEKMPSWSSEVINHLGFMVTCNMIHRFNLYNDPLISLEITHLDPDCYPNSSIGVFFGFSGVELARRQGSSLA